MRKSYQELLHGCRVPRLFLGCIIIIEYIVFSGICDWNNDEIKRTVFLAVGYSMLTVLFTCTNHGLNVRVHYEQELSIIVKNIVANTVMSVFINACDVKCRLAFSKFTGQMLLLTVGQIITVVLVCAIASHISGKKRDGTRLYICDDVDIDLEAVPGAVKYYLSDASKELPLDLIREATEIYLFDLSAEKRNDLLKWCFKLKKPVYFSCKLTDIELQSASLSQDGEIPIYYRGIFRIGRMNAVLKRSFDIFASGLLIIMLTPLFIGISIAVKLEDHGDVFYRQNRCTKGMKEFRIIKFRSMVMDAEKHSGVQIAGKRDPRITKTGYFLRKYKLDELPQLFNIFKGEMSFVGPRPERPELIREAVDEIPEFAFRTYVRAGLTGYAQVHGDYHTTFLDKLKWDAIYIENYSLLLDVKILVMTIPAIIKGSDDMS